MMDDANLVRHLFPTMALPCFLQYRTRLLPVYYPKSRSHHIPIVCPQLGESSIYENDHEEVVHSPLPVDVVITVTTPKTTPSLASSSWEEHLRQEATEALLPVFFPRESTANDNQDDAKIYPVASNGGVGLQRNSIITAELTLKRLLRNKYSRASLNDNDNEITADGDADSFILANTNASRRRLAALVLGTSIMRLRHWYSAVFVVGRRKSGQTNNSMQEEQQKERYGAMLPFHLVPYPLDPDLPAMLLQRNNIDGNGGSGPALVDGLEEISKPSHNYYSDEEKSLVRAMVDEHARYLSSQSMKSDNHHDYDDDEEEDALSIHLQSTSSNNTAMILSIQYSLPPFLTASLLSQFGYEQTKQICIVTNSPGPITLRRNAIRFVGTDNELCCWLKEEDGIDVRRMRWKDDCGKYNNLLMTASNDESNNYIVGGSSSSSSLSGPGVIMPPDGAIKLVPTAFCDESITDTNTTEQRQRRKSIWSTMGWKKGYFEVQDAGSQVIVHSLEVVPGMTILDYCAGNGGKTFGLASLIMANAAAGAQLSTEEGGHSTYYSKIIAHDVVEERLRQIEGSMMRVGFAMHKDGMKGGRRNYIVRSNHGVNNYAIQIETTTDLTIDCQSNSKLFVDAVLVDAPCSSSGVLRRRPSQRWELTEEQINEALPTLQLEVLEKAASFVREDGGRLVYSTCSLLQEENECVANMFELSDLYREGEFERWDFVPGVTSDDHFPAEKGSLDDDDGGAFLKETRSNTITILPTHESDGFFIARWRRRKK